MAATTTPQSRRDDVSRWILTSLALSLLIHLVFVHVVGNIRAFDVEDFSSSISRWFHIVEEPQVPPSAVSTAPTKGLSETGGPPEPVKPYEIPLFNPKERIPGPSFPTETELAVPAHAPSPSRAPDADHAVIHRRGQPKVEQTNAQIGEVAPVRSLAVGGVGSVGSGGRSILRGSPGLPGPPRAQLALRELSAPRPATDTHAGQLAPPTIAPSVTAVVPGTTAPQGIVIPLEDSLARRDVGTSPVIIFPSKAPEDEDLPVYPLGGEVRMRMDLYARPGDERQYFRLEIAVAKADKLPVIPKDVVFICDVSLSMQRSELVATRDALTRYLGALRRTDRFNVILFSEEPRKLFPDFVDPTPERVQAAVAFVDRIPGQVRTDVYRVLNAVVRDVAEQAVRNRPTNIFFISDGRSTLGIRDARRIVNEISAYAKPTFAVLPFDSGGGGNRYLLDLLAYRSRGRATFADDVAEAEGLLGKLFHSYDKPVLMQLRLNYTNLAVEETYPGFLPNLYADQPIVLYGRCKPGENVTIQLQGKIPYAGRTLQYSHTPGAPDPKRDDIARDWARQKIHHLVSDLARVGESSELRAEIQRIGREHNVPTPYDR
ncbi:MAG TPA: VWA domain-containing protein [Planctomycetota bacterium]|nr:VWA domain-containing protein [Planctomycetota bacterium]